LAQQRRPYPRRQPCLGRCLRHGAFDGGGGDGGGGEGDGGGGDSDGGGGEGGGGGGEGGGGGGEGECGGGDGEGGGGLGGVDGCDEGGAEGGVISTNWRLDVAWATCTASR
jgi:hypothetical protein